MQPERSSRPRVDAPRASFAPGGRVNIDEALPTFFAESAELLREMETDLLACTSAAPSADDVNRIFRGAHTLKGSAGLFGFDAIVAFVHEIEACLDRVRLGKAGLDSQLAS